MSKVIRCGLFIMVSCCTSILLHAQISVWTGTIDNDWHDTKNWSGDSLPALHDSVIVDAGTVVIDADVDIKSLVLLNGTHLTNNQIMTLSGSLSDAVQVDGSTMINNAKVEIPDVGDGDFEDRAIDVTNGGTFTNTGSITIGEIDIYGIRVEDGSAFTNAVNATIEIKSQALVAIIVSNANTTFENNGSIDITLQNATGSIRGITAASVGLFTNHNQVTITSTQTGTNVRAITIANNGRYVNTGETEVISVSGNKGLHLSSVGSSFEVEDGIFQIQANDANGIEMTDASELIVLADGDIHISGTIQDYYIDMATDAILDCAGQLQFGN